MLSVIVSSSTNPRRFVSTSKCENVDKGKQFRYTNLKVGDNWLKVLIYFVHVLFIFLL